MAPIRTNLSDSVQIYEVRPEQSKHIYSLQIDFLAESVSVEQHQSHSVQQLHCQVPPGHGGQQQDHQLHRQAGGGGQVGVY